MIFPASKCNLLSERFFTGGGRFIPVTNLKGRHLRGLFLPVADQRPNFHGYLQSSSAARLTAGAFEFLTSVRLAPSGCRYHTFAFHSEPQDTPRQLVRLHRFRLNDLDRVKQARPQSDHPKLAMPGYCPAVECEEASAVTPNSTDDGERRFRPRLRDLNRSATNIPSA